MAAKMKTRELQRAIRAAGDYDTWFEVCQELERLDGTVEWREADESPDYDYALLRSRLAEFRRLRRQGRIDTLVYHLRQGLHWNQGNIGNPLLYQRSRIGTKLLIEEYVEEIANTLDYLCDTDFPNLKFEAKLQLFREAAQSFGRSALMLSGGATLGMFHLGVVKALWEQDLIPDVLSGSSAGSIVASGLGTRPQNRYLELFSPEFIYMEFLQRMKFDDVLRQRAVMEPAKLRGCLEGILGDMTFDQSFQRSGRSINITVSPVHSNQIPRLVNHLTFPHLYVLDAVMASCALPFLFPPTTLMTRNSSGQKEPFMPSLKWVDGTLKSDLPHLRLRRLHNVNHYIVSQTNPHIVPFVQDARRKHNTLVAAARDFAKTTAKYQIGATADLLGRMIPVPAVRKPLHNLHSVLEQDYRGNVTIVPPLRMRDYVGLFSNPTPAMVESLIAEGERATWPQVAMIRCHTRISRTFSACLERLKLRAEDKGLLSMSPDVMSEAANS